MSGAPTTTLLGDLTGTAFGGAPTLSDYTTYLELGQNGQPIEVNRGRQDYQGDIPPATFSFILTNTDGRFTTGASIITPQHFFKVQVTVGGTTYDRAAGYVESVDVLWPGGSSSFGVVRVACVDISGRLGEAQPLRPMTEHEMIIDGPTHLWPLHEDSSSTSGGDVIGTATLSRVDAAAGAGTLTFGADMGMIDGLTGVNFGGAYSGTGAAEVASVLSTRGVAAFGSAWSVELWIVMPSSKHSVSQGDGLLFYHGDGAYFSESSIMIWVDSDGYIWGSLGNHGASDNSNRCDGKLHHMVLTGTTTAFDFYFDTVELGSIAISPAVTIAANPVTQIGGLVANTTGHVFPGTIAAVATYNFQVSAAQVLRHYQAGVGSLIERSDQRFARILSYANLTTSGLPTGAATCGAQPTAGMNVLEALRQVADTEGTDSFVTPSGTLTFQQRQARQNPSSAFTLTASTDISGGTSVRKDRFGLVNDQTIGRAAGATQRVQDSTSSTAFGRRDGGDLTVVPSTDEDAYQNAAWRVANFKDPQLRMSSLPVDLLTQTSTSLLQSIMGATLGTAFTVTGLPSQTPGGTSMSLFVEGYREVIGVDQWAIEFFTSPVTAVQSGVLVLDSSSKGLLDTNRVGF